MNTPYFIESNRLYFREVRPSDANDNYYRWMNDSEITRYLESRFWPNSQEGISEFATRMLSDRNSLFLAMVQKSDDRHIGNIKIGPINWIHRFADLGILIGEKDCWGKGYATEAIDAITSYAFKTLNLNKICAGCYSPNQDSLKAFLKAGYTQEGVRKKQYFCGGEYVDEILVGIANSK